MYHLVDVSGHSSAWLTLNVQMSQREALLENFATHHLNQFQHLGNKPV
jgi:hypothetical protein